MSLIDDRIRTAVHEAAEHIRPTSPEALLSALQAAPVPQPSRPSRGRILAAAAVVAALVAGGVVVGLARADQPDGRTTDVAVGPTDPEPQPSGFAALGSGWHLLDTGPIQPTSWESSLTWTGTELVVVAGGDAHAYDPDAQTWTDLELPGDFGDASFEVAWADGQLVVVGERHDRPAPVAAVLDRSTGQWTMLDAPPLSPKIASLLPAGVGGIGWFGDPSTLVWTGERVLNLRQGAVLDLATGSWSELALPDDLTRFTALVNTTPVRAGSEVLALPWSPTPGLAWSADGSSFREIDPPPGSIQGSFNTVRSALAARVGDEIHLVTSPMAGLDDTATGPRLIWDVANETWSAGDPVPVSMTASVDCPQAMAGIGGRLVVETCDVEVPPVVESAGGWEELPAPPIATTCCLTRWVVAGDALVVWEADADTVNNPDAPYVRAAVWVP